MVFKWQSCINRGFSGEGASSNVQRELDDIKLDRSIECINRGGAMVGKSCI